MVYFPWQQKHVPAFMVYFPYTVVCWADPKTKSAGHKAWPQNRPSIAAPSWPISLFAWSCHHLFACSFTAPTSPTRMSIIVAESHVFPSSFSAGMLPLLHRAPSAYMKSFLDCCFPRRPNQPPLRPKITHKTSSPLAWIGRLTNSHVHLAGLLSSPGKARGAQLFSCHPLWQSWGSFIFLGFKSQEEDEYQRGLFLRSKGKRKT